VDDSLVLGFGDYEAPARRLADALDVPFDLIDTHRFPDGESRVRLPRTELPPELILCRSQDHPNDKLVELLLAAETARSLGSRRIILVAPYWCYMRQDQAFAPGEAISQRIIGKWLPSVVDALVTVDPHLHRVHSLAQVIPGIPTLALSAAEPLRGLLGDLAEAPLVLGPDAESRQWVEAIAAPLGLPFTVARKQRRGDREVHIELPSASYAAQPVVLTDDMASTGMTLVEAARQLRALGTPKIACLITHALFGDGALERLREAGISTVWSADSVPHPSNAVHLAGLLARGVRDIRARLS